jgi:predicted ATPase
MIHTLEVHNFKNLRNLEMDLEPLTVLVGANGSGKTSVLEAIHLAVSASIGPIERLFRGERHCDWLYTRGGQGDLYIACRLQTGEFTVRAKSPAEFPPSPDLLGTGDWKLSTHVGIAPQDVLLPVRRLVFLRLSPARLARASYSDHDPPQVASDGEGLASVLAYMALNDPDAFDELVSHMRTLIPHLKRIRFRKAPIKRTEKEYLRVGEESVERRTNRVYRGEAILFDFTNAENVSAQTVSEGTLMLIGLLTVLLVPPQPKILLMDDLEHGLHPLAQKSLLGVFRQVMERFPDLQIIATAHSPYLLDNLRPEEIRLMTVGEDGFSVCGRLEDHPQYEKWKDEMAPGELWSLFGEKWLLQGGVAK